MALLSEVVHISKRREGRKERIIPWSEFEPYFNQLRIALNANQDKVFKYVGYAGGTMVNAWHKVGVPVIALNAFKWVLHDLKQPLPTLPKPPVPSQFTFDELTDLFDAVRGRSLPEDNRRALIKKLSTEIAK